MNGGFQYVRRNGLCSLIIEGVLRMKSTYNRIVAILGATSICVMLLIGCGSSAYTTIRQVGTISYQNGSSMSPIDLSQWIVSGTAPNSGTIPLGTTVKITSIIWIPTQSIQSQQWPGPIPPSGVTDQAVQVTAGDTEPVKK
jgi:hypothetical protein